MAGFGPRAPFGLLPDSAQLRRESLWGLSLLWGESLTKQSLVALGVLRDTISLMCFVCMLGKRVTEPGVSQIGEKNVLNLILLCVFIFRAHF